MTDVIEQYFIKCAYKFTPPSYSQCPLISATYEGDIDTMTNLLNSGIADVNQTTEKNVTALWCACYRGNKEALEILLSNHADPNIPDIYQQTPLFVACYQGNIENVQLLIDHGGSITHRDYENHTPLHSAADSGKEEVIKLLLQVDEELQNQNPKPEGEESIVNYKDMYGNTALHYAAANNQLDSIDALIAGGCDVDAQNQQLKTALHIASELGFDYVVDVLIDEGADMSLIDEEGRTPLHIACAEGKKPCIELLLANGAEMSTLDSYGLSVLHLAALNGHSEVVRSLCQGVEVSDNMIRAIDPNILDANSRNAIFAAAEFGDLALCQQLQQYGTDVRHKDKDQRNMLFYSTHWCDQKFVNWAISHFIDINSKDEAGRTALHYTCYFGNFSGASTLLQNNVNVDEQDKDGTTPLLAALHEYDNNDKSELVELLVDHNANVGIADRHGNTPLHICASFGDVETLEILIDTYVDRKLSAIQTNISQRTETLINSEYINRPNNSGLIALHFAAINKQIDNFEFLIQRDANVNAKDNRGNTVLMWAIKTNSTECFTYLLEECNVDLEELNEFGESALSIAISISSYEFVQKLLEVNPNLVTISSPSGRSPLHYASYFNDASILKLLMFYSAKLIEINGTDMHGRTGLHRAARVGNVDSLTILLSKGVNLDAQDKDGVTALMYAAYYGHNDCVQFLIENGANVNLLDNKRRDYLKYQVSTRSHADSDIPPDDVVAPAGQVVDISVIEKEAELVEQQNEEIALLKGSDDSEEHSINNEEITISNKNENNVVSGDVEPMIDEDNNAVVVSNQEILDTKDNDNESNDEEIDDITEDKDEIEVKQKEVHKEIDVNEQREEKEKDQKEHESGKNEIGVRSDQNLEPSVPVATRVTNIKPKNNQIVAASWFRIPFISVIFTCAALSFVLFFKKSSYFKK